MLINLVIGSKRVPLSPLKMEDVANDIFHFFIVDNQ